MMSEADQKIAIEQAQKRANLTGVMQEIRVAEFAVINIEPEIPPSDKELGDALLDLWKELKGVSTTKFIGQELRRLYSLLKRCE